MKPEAQTVWVIYRPVMDWEESEEMHAACATEADADAVIAECVAYVEALAESLPDVGEEMDEDQYETAWKKRRAMIENADWPHGINLSGEISYTGSSLMHSGFMKARELNVIQPLDRR